MAKPKAKPKEADTKKAETNPTKPVFRIEESPHGPPRR
jgi:hypothetical protein